MTWVQRQDSHAVGVTKLVGRQRSHGCLLCRKRKIKVRSACVKAEPGMDN